MTNHSKLTENEKFDLVMALLRKEATASELARRHSVSEPTIGPWRDEFLDGGKRSLARKGKSEDAGEIKRLKAELADHKQVIGEYAFANDFLKKRLEISRLVKPNAMNCGRKSLETKGSTSTRFAVI